MKVYAIANQKGGIGKTTTAVALASILNAREHKTLFIDADPQCNSTDTYRAESENVATLFDVILADELVPIDKAIQHTESGDVVASDKLLVKSDALLSQKIDGLRRLKKAIVNSDLEKNYEYVVIDTAPTLGHLLFNCLIAADEVIIPVTTDRYGIQGLTELKKSIDLIREEFNPGLKIAGLLLVMYDERTRLSKTVKSFLSEASSVMDTTLFETAIRRSVKAKEAQTNRELLIKYSPCCTTERDYEAFVDVLTGEEW